MKPVDGHSLGDAIEQLEAESSALRLLLWSAWYKAEPVLLDSELQQAQNLREAGSLPVYDKAWKMLTAWDWGYLDAIQHSLDVLDRVQGDDEARHKIEQIRLNVQDLIEELPDHILEPDISPLERLSEEVMTAALIGLRDEDMPYVWAYDDGFAAGLLTRQYVERESSTLE